MGIRVHDCDDVTILNGTVTGFHYGIQAHNVCNLNIRGCVVSDNANPTDAGWLPDTAAPVEEGFGGGIYLYKVRRSVIENNQLNNNFNGVSLVRFGTQRGPAEQRILLRQCGHLPAEVQPKRGSPQPGRALHTLHRPFLVRHRRLGRDSPGGRLEPQPDSRQQPALQRRRILHPRPPTTGNLPTTTSFPATTAAIRPTTHSRRCSPRRTSLKATSPTIPTTASGSANSTNTTVKGNEIRACRFDGIAIEARTRTTALRKTESRETATASASGAIHHRKKQSGIDLPTRRYTISRNQITGVPGLRHIGDGRPPTRPSTQTTSNATAGTTTSNPYSPTRHTRLTGEKSSPRTSMRGAPILFVLPAPLVLPDSDPVPIRLAGLDPVTTPVFLTKTTPGTVPFVGASLVGPRGGRARLPLPRSLSFATPYPHAGRTDPFRLAGPPRLTGLRIR